MGESIEDIIERVKTAKPLGRGLQVRNCLIIMFPQSSIKVSTAASEMSGCNIVQADLLDFEIPEGLVPVVPEEEGAG